MGSAVSIKKKKRKLNSKVNDINLPGGVRKLTEKILPDYKTKLFREAKEARITFI